MVFSFAMKEIHPDSDPHFYFDYHNIPGMTMINGCMATSGSLVKWFAHQLAEGMSLSALDREAEAIPQQIQTGNIEAWKYAQSNQIDHAPPGGENYAQLRERAARALKRSWESFAEQTVLWMTHGELIGATLCYALGLDLSYRRCFQRDNTSVTELRFGQGLPVIVRLNDTSHLHPQIKSSGLYLI